MRFERAFGGVPGIALAAVCFGAYHAGTFLPFGVASLAAFETFFGVLFGAAGGNLLVLWPLTWAVMSSIGVLEGGFGWSDVATYAILLVVQAALIALMAWRKVRLGRDGEALGRLAPPGQ